MESILIVLVVTALAALSNWLQRRGQSQPDPSSLPPSQGPQVPPVGQPTALPRAQRSPANPPPHSQPAPSLETVLERELRRLMGEPPLPTPSHPQPPAVPKPARTWQEAPLPTQVAPHRSPEREGLPTNLDQAALAEAGSAYSRAQHIHETVDPKLRHAARSGGILRPINRVASPKPISSELEAIRSIGRSPRAARHAFIAALVFGEPKGINPEA